MKPSVSILLGSLALAGCAGGGENAAPHAPIRFGVTTTRAAVTTARELQSGFRVFATAGNVASTHTWYPGIDGTNDHIYSGGRWGFQDPVSWPSDAAEYPITFYAWYPPAPAGMSLSEDPAVDPVLLRAAYTVQAAGGEDFVAGKNTANIRPIGGNLIMSFDHLLSKLDLRIAAAAGAETVVQAWGVANVGDTRIFDFVAGEWTSAQPATATAHYAYRGESLMLMPQTGTVWVPVKGSVPASGDGLIYMLYRMTVDQPAGYPADEVGYASARSHPGWTEGGYEGALYALAGFPLSEGATFTWLPGKGYTYDIGLGSAGSSGGYLLSGYYYDETGVETAFPVRDGRVAGEKLNDGAIHVTLGVGGWDDQPASRALQEITGS